jgi:ribulose-phosphate 3-epimerase
MAVVVPAILEDTVELFQSKIGIILKLPNLKKVQIDISDGMFTPRTTIQLTDIDLLSPVIEWEAHLMVNNPQEYFFDAQLAGITTIIIHFEAITDQTQLKNLSDSIRKLKIKSGLAISSETTVDQTLPFIDFFDQVLLLGVRPGYQGQEMDSGLLEKLKKLKNAYKTGIIEVDGGVKISNIRQLRDAGADLLVVGSALFESAEKGFTSTQNFDELNSFLT